MSAAASREPKPANNKGAIPSGTGQAQSGSLRVLIGHPMPLVREGLEALVERSGRMRVAGQTGDRDDLVQMARETQPHLILTALHYGDDSQMELIPALRQHSTVPVLVMLSASQRNAVAKAISAGATGCIMEDASPQVFRVAMETVADGRIWVQRELTDSLVEGMQRTGKLHGHPFSDLTRREAEVAQFVAAGRNDDSIADNLFVQPSTVRAHVSHILCKLGLRNRVELVLYLFREGLVDS